MKDTNPMLDWTLLVHLLESSGLPKEPTSTDLLTTQRNGQTWAKEPRKSMMRLKDASKDRIISMYLCLAVNTYVPNLSSKSSFG
jgi:hypothetical protein